ncbi:aminotransferase [Corticibacterium sp. UT-5YL-CI-8]|nr:aminotransferase [Tianweitania sp. UT-5YL-CI-8]
MSLDQAEQTSDSDVRFHLHSQTNPRGHIENGPFVATRGKGAHVYDDSGKSYIDAMAGLWCTSLGFDNARLAAAASKQYAQLGYYHSFYGRTNPVTAALARKLVELAEIPGGKTYFTTSGSEANESMVKFAWIYHAARGKPTKRKVISRHRAFHGSTIVAASMCGLEMMHREFGLPLPGFIHTLCPDNYTGRLAGETEAAFVARLAFELERQILREGPDTIAAFIAEPVMAGGGIIPPPAGYFEAIQSVLAKYDILLLDDEIVCGFGRTGNWFGFQTVGMKPDMMSMAKGITSSYFPLSAVVMRPEIYEAIEKANAEGTVLGHGFTNGGHPVGAAVALEAIAIYEEMDVVGYVRRIGALLHERLAAACAGSPIAANLRGVGMMYGVELVADPSTGLPFAPARKVGAQLASLAMERGLIVRAMRDTIGFCPPLIVGEAEVEEIGSKFEDSLHALALAGY